MADIDRDMENLYDLVLYLDSDAKEGLKRAQQAKQEFESGDAMENMGEGFMEQVQQNFYKTLKKFKSEIIEVEILEDKEKGIQATFDKIIDVLEKRGVLD